LGAEFAAGRGRVGREKFGDTRGGEGGHSEWNGSRDICNVYSYILCIAGSRFEVQAGSRFPSGDDKPRCKGRATTETLELFSRMTISYPPKQSLDGAPVPLDSTRMLRIGARRVSKRESEGLSIEAACLVR
jgi:hypothetical protein